MPSSKVAFLGASTGVGLSALSHCLAAGYECIALCRDPSKLTAIFPLDRTPSLKIIKGNAHSLDHVTRCLVAQDGTLVDAILTTIGGRPVLSKLTITIDDPQVCRKGAATLIQALSQLQRGGVQGSPHILACSTTGISSFGRDVPLAMVPLYHFMLKIPFADKRSMEDRLVESGYLFTVIRPSLLVDGETDREIRVGVEDPKTGRESSAIGYTLSREDAGRWIFENLIAAHGMYANKIVMITY